MSAAAIILSRRVIPSAGIAREGLALVVLMVVAGLVSVFVLGQDANWDLQNYHFYNAWAYVNGRMGWDLAPAQLQSFHNPLIELPFYWMVTAGWPPRVIAFAMGLPAGVSAFFLGKILLRLFCAFPRYERWGYAALAFVIGVTASGPVSLLGSTMNEWQCATLIVIALWSIVRVPPTRELGWPSVVSAGLLCGVASGLKLTAATYAVGLCVALLVQASTVRRGFVNAFTFGVAECAGLALTCGPWMWKLWSRFDNPLFPYFNHVFRSPWWDRVSLLPRVYGPHSLWDWLTFPTRFMTTEASFVSEMAFSDWRIPLVYLFLIAAGVAWLHCRRVGRPVVATVRADAAWRTVAAFWLVSFVLWGALHSVYRYLIPLELLTGALLLYLLGRLFERRWLPIAAVAITLGALYKVQYPDWSRVPYGRTYFEVSAPALPPNSLVMLVDDQPMAYVIPFLRIDARFVGANNNFNSPGRNNRLAHEVEHVIQTHPGPLFSLTFPAGSGSDVVAALQLQRANEPCQSIVTNMETSPIELCRLERIAPPAISAIAVPGAAIPAR